MRRGARARPNRERTTARGARPRGESPAQRRSARSRPAHDPGEEVLRRARTPTPTPSQNPPPIAASARGARARRTARSRRRARASAGLEPHRNACTRGVRPSWRRRREVQAASTQERRREAGEHRRARRGQASRGAHAALRTSQQRTPTPRAKRHRRRRRQAARHARRTPAWMRARPITRLRAMRHSSREHWMACLPESAAAHIRQRSNGAHGRRMAPRI